MLLLIGAMLAGKKARDLRNWLTIYSYWNQGGLENVTSMLLYLVDNYSRPTGIAPSALLETPGTGKADKAHAAVSPYLLPFTEHTLKPVKMP